MDLYFNFLYRIDLSLIMVVVAIVIGFIIEKKILTNKKKLRRLIITIIAIILLYFGSEYQPDKKDLNNTKSINIIYNSVEYSITDINEDIIEQITKDAFILSCYYKYNLEIDFTDHVSLNVDTENGLYKWPMFPVTETIEEIIEESQK